MSAAHPPEPQDVDKPLTAAAAFLVLTVAEDDGAAATVRSVLAGVGDLVKNVQVRASRGFFSCNVGLGHAVWPRLSDAPRPRDLRPFREVRGARHVAPATPGDVLLHLRADTPDLIVELERVLLDRLGEAVVPVDDVAGFRYFDGRDLLGFVDGTANPTGLALPEATLVGEEDPAHAGGSYVVVQKYLHDLARWQRHTTEEQEAVIGRTKLDNVELPDAGEEEQKSHKTLCTVEDDRGEHDILRDNMPFASPGRGEYGTYFVGYSRHLWVVERMLERMFVGDPPGLHDRVLDVSTAVTGSTFFAPSRPFLDGLAG